MCHTTELGGELFGVMDRQECLSYCGIQGNSHFSLFFLRVKTRYDSALSSSPCLCDLRGSSLIEVHEIQLPNFPSGTVTGLWREMPDRKSPRLGQRVGRLRSTSAMAMSPHFCPPETMCPAWS